MSGVETRTRLEQLVALWRRTRHEIQVAHREGTRERLGKLQSLEARLEEEIRAAGGVTQPSTGTSSRQSGRPRSQRQKAEDRVTRHLERLGVTAHDVKVWAVGQGLLPAVRRGRVKGDLVASYEAAHTCEENGAA